MAPVVCSALMMFEQGARLRAMNEKREGGYVGSDSSSEEEEIEEELGYFSPLDSVNPYDTFKHALTSSSSCNFLCGLANALDRLTGQESHSIPGRNDFIRHRTADRVD